jgi:acetoin utilization protein AcuB
MTIRELGRRAMTIRELMTGGLITVHPGTSVQDARDLMVRKRIRHLPVTGPGGVLVGILTDRDIRLALPSRATSLSVREINHLLTRLTVEEVMTRSVITIGPDRAARDGAQLMLEHRIGALPVLDDGHLIGIITETDIVRAFVDTTAAASPSRP